MLLIWLAIFIVKAVLHMVGKIKGMLDELTAQQAQAAEENA